MKYQQFLSDSVSTETESLRNNKKEILEIKNTIKELKNIFDGLISRLDMAEGKNLRVRKVNRKF